VPTTGLGASIVNARAVIGMVGHHSAAARTKMGQLFAHELPAEFADQEEIGYFALEARHIADAILYVIDQPWGVSISDITVRASGEPYLL
jgi:NADP-dependent 3-hydroxy acid dehydrogenase YdfG